MNETDFIRQQLTAERMHLREILEAVRHGTAATQNARPIVRYIDWAGRRLLQQLSGVKAALDEGVVDFPEGHDTLPARHWLALLDAWTEPLDAQAARTLRIHHWRRVARLSADSILEERQLYAAARDAVGLS